MKVLIQYDGVSARDLPLKPATIRRLFAICLREVQKDPEWGDTCRVLGGQPASLSILFCTDGVMRAYQLSYRGLDRTTDILSFPSAEGPAMRMPDEDRTAGDLIVSLPAVARGAKRGRRKPAAEMIEVLVHGWLHLLGCDHVHGGAQAKRMRSLQRRLFEKARRTIRSA
jgi:rRNA maturation RNase YbeY